MNETVVVALVAAGSAIMGAVLAAAAATYSARQKLSEIRIQYEQKLHETYLINARKYVENVYLPIGVALGKLDDEYRIFRQHVDLVKEEVQPSDTDSVGRFLKAIKEYDSQVKDLFDRGADSFLTTELEESLRSFNSFIRGSIDTKATIVKVVFSYEFSVFGLRTYGRRAGTVRGRRAVEMDVSIAFPGIGVGFRASGVLAAPIASRDFEERFLKGIPRIKYLIKEVTLGAHVKLLNS